jgi:hypothetical protein
LKKKRKNKCKKKKQRKVEKKEKKGESWKKNAKKKEKCTGGETVIPPHHLDVCIIIIQYINHYGWKNKNYFFTLLKQNY